MRLSSDLMPGYLTDDELAALDDADPRKAPMSCWVASKSCLSAGVRFQLFQFAVYWCVLSVFPDLSQIHEYFGSMDKSMLTLLIMGTILDDVTECSETCLHLYVLCHKLFDLFFKRGRVLLCICSSFFWGIGSDWLNPGHHSNAEQLLDAGCISPWIMFRLAWLFIWCCTCQMCCFYYNCNHVGAP